MTQPKIRVESTVDKSGRGHPSAPLHLKPEHFAHLITPRGLKKLLEIDPAAVLVHCLDQGADPANQRAICAHLFNIANTIRDQIARNGLPRNPDTGVVLKSLFYPEVLREGIAQVLSAPHSHYFLMALTTICFIYHQAQTLQEIQFLSRQMIRSPGQKKVWREVADGLIQACVLVPERWTDLEPGQFRVPKGPDFLDARLKELRPHELVTFPACVVERALGSRKPLSTVDSASSLAIITSSSRGFLEMPGFIPVLRYLKQADPPPDIPAILVSKITRDLQTALTIRGESGPISAWVRSHRSGEPMRRHDIGEAVLIAFIGELLEFAEFKDALSQYGQTSLDIYGGIQSDRATLLFRARNVVRARLSSDSDFGPADIESIVSALDDYDDQSLNLCINTGENVGSVELKNLSFMSGCTLAMLCAYLSPVKHRYLESAFVLHRNDKSDPAPQALIRVILRVIKPADLRAIQSQTLRGDTWRSLFNAWELLPNDNDVFLFSALIRSGAAFKIPFAEITRGCRKWGGLSDEFIQELQHLPPLQRTDRVDLFLTALSKIRNQDPDFGQWRTSLIEQIVTNSDILGPQHQEVLISLIYQENLTQELQESGHSAGIRTNVCSLRISSRDEAALGSDGRSALKHLNRWMNGAFSDYALDRGLFTSTAVFLEGYGQTKRTLRDLLHSVKVCLRSNPKSVPTRKIYQALSEFVHARDTGSSLERLRRKLAQQDLLQYREADVPFIVATETYLRRHGLRESKRPLTQFPALMLLRKIRSFSTDATPNRKPSIRTVTRSPEELEGLISQCRQVFQRELRFRRPIALPQLLSIPPERRHIRSIGSLIGGVLLGGTLTIFGLGKAVERLPGQAASQSEGAAALNSDQGLTPNGSLPGVERPIATLSSPFRDPRHRFMILGLVGASSGSARQPPLHHRSADLVETWHTRASALGNNERIPVEFHSTTREGRVALPLGARLQQGNALEARNIASTFEIQTFDSPVIDISRSAQDLILAFGGRHSELYRPRLPFSDIQSIDAALAESITLARTMKAADAVSYLRNVVETRISYVETPEYDQFQGTFSDYLRTILSNGKGICGQYSVVLDEALKQAGIPACIATGFMPNDDQITYTTRGAHAANIVFLLSPDGTLAPHLIDATGGRTQPQVPEYWNDPIDLLVPGAAIISGLGLASIALNRRRRRLLEQRENEALDRVNQSPAINNEPAREILPSIRPETKPRSQGVDPESILSAWVRYHLRVSPESESRHATNQTFRGIEDFDIDALLQTADLLKRELTKLTPLTEDILAKTGLSSDPATVGILNGWLRYMQDPARRREWMTHIQDRRYFKKAEAHALQQWAERVVPELRDLRRFPFFPRPTQFSRTPELTNACLLRALAPKDTMGI